MTQYCSLEDAFPNHKKPKQKQVETFESTPKKTYSSQKSDYDYMCKTAGICVYPDKFENGTSPAPAPPEKCEPLQPPKYEFQFSDEDKRRFRQALKVALEEMETSNPPSRANPTPTPNVDMSGVNGYIDEELESYMMVNDMKPAIHHEPVPVKKTEPVVGLESPLTTSLSDTLVNKQTTSYVQPYTKKNKMLFELLLFSVGGVLIILLLEEIYKIAEQNGIKKALLLIDKIYEATKQNGI